MLSFDPERIWMSEAWCHMICRAGDVRSFHVTWHVWALSRWWEKWDGDYRFHLGDFEKCVFPPCKWVLMFYRGILWISNSRLVLCHYTGCVRGLSPVLFPVAHQHYVTFLTISWNISTSKERLEWSGCCEQLSVDWYFSPLRLEGIVCMFCVWLILQTLLLESSVQYFMCTFCFPQVILVVAVIHRFWKPYFTDHWSLAKFGNFSFSVDGFFWHFA